MTQIGIVAELAGENRVAASPSTVAKFITLGYTVAVETGAGARASFPDRDYAAAGATIVDRSAAWASPLVVKVASPTDEEIDLLANDATLIGLLAPALRPGDCCTSR